MKPSLTLRPPPPPPPPPEPEVPSELPPPQAAARPGSAVAPNVRAPARRKDRLSTPATYERPGSGPFPVGQRRTTASARRRPPPVRPPPRRSHMGIRPGSEREGVVGEERRE